MNKKFYFIVAMLLLIVIFTLQNAQVITINLLFWKLTLPRALMIFIVLIIGILIGWLVTGQTHRSKH